MFPPNVGAELSP